MLIGIDGNEANIENKVGVNQMAFEMIWGLYKLEDREKRGHKFTIYLKSSPRPELPKGNKYWKYEVIPGRGFWVITKLMPRLWFGERPNIFFTPSHYLPPISFIPQVCVITDLGYLEFSGQFRNYDFWQLKYWTAISLYISKYIITISNSASKDIVRHYPAVSKKVKTVYLGPDTIFERGKAPEKLIRQTLQKYRISKNYIIFVSTLKPGKNVEGLIEAFREVRKSKDVQLVIGGKKGWLYDSIFELVKEYELQKDVVFTGYLTEEEKWRLISGAIVLVQPSFWEGFGILILNAFSCGVPVVVSKVASLPEIAGQAAIYIEPKNTKSIVGGLKKVLTLSSNEYTKLVNLGYSRLKRFSWNKAALGIMDIFEKSLS